MNFDFSFRSFDPRRALALAAVALAGLASMADEPEPMHWTIESSVAGPALTLGAASPDGVRKTEHLTATFFESVGSDFGNATVTLDATACVSPANAGARLRLIALADQAATQSSLYATPGQAAEISVPLCPATVTLNAAAVVDSYATSCSSANTCTMGFTAVFERAGDTTGDMQVTWNANGVAKGYNSKQPPAGSTFTLTVDP